MKRRHEQYVPRRETVALAFDPSANPLAGGIPGRLAVQRRHRRRHARRLRDSGIARLCHSCGPASAGRRLWLSAGRARLRLARLVAPTGDRADLGHLADDRRNRRSDGGRRRTTLRADRQPRGVHGGGALPVLLAVAAERAGEADQRQHPGRLQDRRGTDHRDDPAAEPVRRGRRRAQFLRARRAAWPGSSARCTTSGACRRRHRDRAALARRAPAAGKAGCARRRRCCRSSPQPCLDCLRSACRRREKFPPACPALEGPALRLRDVEGHRSAGRRVPAARLYRGRLRRPHLRRQARLCLDPRQEFLGIGAANSLRRRWDMAIPWRADCRNRP